MAERYLGDGAATNGFGRRTLQAWEACLLYEARYVAPPNTRTPPGWKLSAGGIPIPPAPTSEELPYQIQEFISGMDDPSATESPNNLLYREEFFADRRAQELARHEGPQNESSLKCNNAAGRRRFWSAPGRTLRSVMDHINVGNTPRHGYPHTPVPVSRSGRRPQASWMPRRMASMSSSSSASASHSSGSTPIPTPTGPSSGLRPVKREAVSPVRSPPRTRSRGKVIGEPRIPTLSAPIGCLRPRHPKNEPADDAPPPEDSAFRFAVEQSLRDLAPQPQPPLVEPSTPDILAWSRRDWEEMERQHVLRLQQQAEEQAPRRQALAGHALAYQGAPLFVLDDDGRSYQPWRCGDAGQGSSHAPQPPSDDDDDGGKDDGRTDPGYTAFYNNFGM